MGWTLVWAIVALVLAAGSAYMASQAGVDNNTDEQQDRGREVTTRSTERELAVPYGINRIYCNEVYIGSSGTDLKYFHIIGTISEGPIQGILQTDGTYWDGSGSPSGTPCVYLDDKLYTDYGSLVTLEFYRGTSSQNTCATLHTAIPEWDEPQRYTAYIYLRLEYDKDKWQGKPSEIVVIIKGLEVYNTSTTATEYSNNPSLCVRDFMTQSSQRGRMGIPEARMADSTFTTVMGRCATKGWTCNMKLDNKDDRCGDMVPLLLNCFRGSVIRSGTQFKLRYKDLNFSEDDAVLSLDEDDVVDGTLTVRQPDAFDRPNAIRAKYYTEDGDATGQGKYMEADYIHAPPSLQTEDGDYREDKIELWGLTNQEKLQGMCNYYLERARLNKTVKMDLIEKGATLEPADIVEITWPDFGWVNKKLRVLVPALQPDHTVALSLIEEATTFYDDTYNLTAHDWHTTTLPDPTSEPPNVENFAVSESTYDFRLRTASRITVTFDAPTNYPWYDKVEVWTSLDAGSTWKHQFNSTDNCYIEGVQEQETYYVRLRTVSIWGTKREFANCTTKQQYIGGPTSSPGDLADLKAVVNANTINLFSTKLDDPDIEIYEFRLGSSWSGAIFLAASRAPNFSLYGVKPGSHTFWCATKNTKGVYCDGPQDATAALIDPPDGWAVLDSDVCDYDAVGTHDNTEHVTYDSDDYLKCSHTAGVLTGIYKSQTFDLGASGRYLIYVSADIVVTGTGTTWDDQFPGSTTWDDAQADTRTWNNIFQLSDGPSVKMRCNYGVAAITESTVERLEILSAIATGRYFQVEIEITDPSTEINALVENFTIKYCQGA